MTVYLIGTLDTKGDEVQFLKQALTAHGVAVTVVDVGSSAPPTFTPEVSRDEVLQSIGTSLEDIGTDRGDAVSAMTQAIAVYLAIQHREGKVAGVLSIGGSAGTSIGTSAMRALPIGVPKLMVSTMASGQVRPYVADKDIMMMNSVVDFAGLNRISRLVLTEAAAAMAGLAQDTNLNTEPSAADKPLIAATMFGVTTPCIQAARRVLEDAGYEVLVFHATGTGGQAMESLIRDGLITGVLDITTTELADELVGGTLSAGPDRLTAAAECGVPQVVSVGALDMVNFGARDTVPPQFADRQFYQHNPVVTLMRTTPEECRTLGEQLAEKVSRSQGPWRVLFPNLGVSAIDQTGQPFDDPAARDALRAALASRLDAEHLNIQEQHINDTAFAEAAARELIELIESNR